MYSRSQPAVSTLKIQPARRLQIKLNMAEIEEDTVMDRLKHNK